MPSGVLGIFSIAEITLTPFCFKVCLCNVDWYLSLENLSNLYTRTYSHFLLKLSLIIRWKSGRLSFVPVIALSIYSATISYPFFSAYSLQTLNCPSMLCSVWLSLEYLAYITALTIIYSPLINFIILIIVSILLPKFILEEWRISK